MTNFNSTQLTDAGLRLLAREGTGISFTRVETGCGEYIKDEDVSGMTSIKDNVQEFGISNVSVMDDTKINLKFSISNKTLEETYLLTEIGVYALDPDAGEILYAVCYSTKENAEKILKYNGVFEANMIVSLSIHVNNAGNVTFQTSGVYALVEDVVAYTDIEVIEDAFQEIFGSAEEYDPNALTASEINEAVDTEWNGESSEDSNALSASDVNNAVNTEWSGESSEDSNALSASDINEAVGIS